MILHPKPGMRVQVWYRKDVARTMPFHATVGVVVESANGKGPRNAAVRTDDGTLVVVPRGNIRPHDDSQLKLF